MLNTTAVKNESFIATPPRAISIRRGVSWVFGGNVVAAASNWLILSLITKLADVDNVGVYALGLAVAQPVMTFALLHLRAVQATDAEHTFRFNEYVALRLITTVVALVGIVGFLQLTRYGPGTRLAILLAATGMAIQGLSDIVHGLMQQYERMDWTGRSVAFRGVAVLLATATGLYCFPTAAVAHAMIAVASALILICYDIPRALTLTRRLELGLVSGISWRALMRLTILAAPLGLTTLLISLNQNVSRYCIEYFMGAKHLGVFAAAASLVAIGNTFVAAVTQTTAPRLSRYYAARDIAAFRRLSSQLVLLVFIISLSVLVVVALAGSTLMTLLFTRAYASEPSVLNWLVAGGGFLYVSMCYGSALTAARRFAPQFKVGVLVTAVAAGAAFTLIPRYGLLGAAISVFLSMMVRCAALWLLYANVIREPVASTSHAGD